MVIKFLISLILFQPICSFISYYEDIRNRHVVVHDAYFSQAVEDFAKPSLPDEIGKCVKLMGCPCYVCREIGTRRLRGYFRKDPDQLRFLFPVLRTKDPEVYRRVYRIIQRSFPCESCKGRGWMNWSNHITACFECGRTGSMWRDIDRDEIDWWPALPGNVRVLK